MVKIFKYICLELKLIFVFTALIIKNLGGSKQIFQAVESA